MRRSSHPLCRRQVAVAILALTSVACNNTAKGPEPVVERFLRSVNDKDLNVMLSCIDPRQERMFRASFRLVEKITGGNLPVQDLLELVPGLYQIFRNNLDADFSVQDFHVYRAKVDGDEAEVPIILTVFTRSGAITKAEKLRLHFTMHRFDADWRIVGIPTD